MFKIKKSIGKASIIIMILLMNLINFPILASSQLPVSNEYLLNTEESSQDGITPSNDTNIDLGQNISGNINISSTPPVVKYQTHVQNLSWLPYVQDGTLSGTEGKAYRLEAIKIYLESDEDVQINYSTHIQNIGWQNWKTDNDVSGTEGMSLRLEAIKIKLTGADSDKYDVYYQVHIQDHGWLDWAKNTEAAGSEGLSKRLEAIKIKIVPKGADLSAYGITTGKAFLSNIGTGDIIYKTHVQNLGWTNWTDDGKTSGTIGKSQRIEALMVHLGADVIGPASDGSISYKVHIQDYGWQDWQPDSSIAGTTGQAKRIEAIAIKLEGDAGQKYDVYYRVHVQNYGWLGWAQNGQESGTAGFSYRAEAIEIVLVEKGQPAPGDTNNHFIENLITPTVDLDALPGDIVYLQIQKSGNFLFNNNNELKKSLLNYNNQEYLWKIIPYNNGYILQNIATKKVLDVDFNINDFNNVQGQIWNLNLIDQATDTYTFSNSLNSLLIDESQYSTIGKFVLAATNGSYEQKINIIYTNQKGNYEIIGASQVTKDTMKNFLIDKVGFEYYNSSEKIAGDSNLTRKQYYDRVIDAYYQIAPIYGIRPEVALAQAFHETGYMKFGGLVTIDQFNFAGISATGSSISTTDIKGADPNKVKLIIGEKAARFSSIESGVEGHIQHLVAYATTINTTDINNDGILELNGQTLADPRFVLVSARGASPIIPALNGKWAVPGYTYGQMIMNILEYTAPQYSFYSPENGIYTIDSLYSDLRLDVKGGSLTNGAEIIQYNSNGGNNQFWHIEKLPDGSYRIVSIKSGKALTMNQGNVTQETWINSTNQKWHFYKTPDGMTKIVNISSSLVLDLQSESLEPWVKIIGNQGGLIYSQNFKLTPSGFNIRDIISETKGINDIGGVYKISNQRDNKVIDVPYTNPRNGIGLNQYFDNGGIAQQFKLIRLSTGHYKIMATNSGKLLTTNNYDENGQIYQWYDQGNNPSQVWQLIAQDNGYLIKSIETNKYINGSVETLVQTNQPLKWNLTYLSAIPNDKEKTTGVAGKVIVIDPGHGAIDTYLSGYYDPGAGDNGLIEAVTNTWFAFELGDKLKNAGATVIYTHTNVGNNNPPTLGLRERAYNASKENADIFISVHSNASTSSYANGAEIYYYDPDLSEDPFYTQRDPRIKDSMLLAQAIQPKMAAGGGYVNRGVKGADYAVIRETAMPAVLLEIGFITNPEDAAKINDPNNRTNVVNGIYDGIVEYFNNYLNN